MKIFMLLGKSGSGKDTMFRELAYKSTFLNLTPIIPSTTRPMREGEIDGREYFFLQSLDDVDCGDVLSLRAYHTTHGVWYYLFDLSQVTLKRDGNYILVGTPQAYVDFVKRFGGDAVTPVIIDVDDGERVRRLVKREEGKSAPDYGEFARRLLADNADFSTGNLEKMGLAQWPVFINDDFQKCLHQVESFIESQIPTSLSDDDLFNIFFAVMGGECNLWEMDKEADLMGLPRSEFKRAASQFIQRKSDCFGCRHCVDLICNPMGSAHCTGCSRQSTGDHYCLDRAWLQRILDISDSPANYNKDEWSRYHDFMYQAENLRNALA